MELSQQFMDKLEECLQKGISVQLLADQLGVATPSIHHWKRGVSLPHPGLVPVMVEAMDKLIAKI